MTLLYIYFGVCVIMNIIAFAAMGIDKHKAQTGQWRIPEKTLFLFTFLLGGLGGTAGMFFFHHKTKHWYFRLGFPFFLILQIALTIFVCYYCIQRM